MVGTIVIIVILLLLVPVGIIMSSIIGALAIGTLVNDEVDARHEDSELLELSKQPY